MRLSNNKKDNKEISDIVKELKKFVAGGATSNNLLNFVDGETPEEKELVNAFQSLAFSNNNKEAEIERIKNNYLHP